MRLFSLVVALFLVAPTAFAQAKLTPRPLDAMAAETLAHAVAGSEVVRELVARLEASNVIVHIETTLQMPSRISGITRFVTSRGGYRYVRITIGSDQPLRARSGILGHELTHACEIAESDASDVDGLRALFEHEGHRTGQYFETMAAIRTERDVLRQLRTPRSLQTEPVAKFHH